MGAPMPCICTNFDSASACGAHLLCMRFDMPRQPRAMESGAASACLLHQVGIGIALTLMHALPWRSRCGRHSLDAQADHAGLAGIFQRSEERRVGKECVRMCKSRWGPYL